MFQPEKANGVCTFPVLVPVWTGYSLDKLVTRPQGGRMGQGAGTKDTRARILSGGMKTLGRLGIQATTVEDILRTAGVSRRTFYQYFNSKEGLLEALYEEATERMVETVDAAVGGADDGPSKIKASMEAYLAFQRAGGPVLIHMQADAVRPESRLATRREKTLDSLVEIVGQNVQLVLGQDLDPLIYRALLIGIEGLVIHCQVDGTFGDEDVERVGAIAVPMLFSVLASFDYLPKRQ